MIRAEVIADSVSPQGKRLTTMKWRYPWFVHGEVMTHRVFSRNASSNRAVPLRKMLEEVRSDELRAEPVYWGAEQKGMEPGGELAPQAKKDARDQWRFAALSAADSAEAMHRTGLHKSLCNRLLMPFTHANVVVTATEWDNFFGLRLDRAADPTMRALAVAAREAMRASEPRLLRPGQWHLPFTLDDEGFYDLRLYPTVKGIYHPHDIRVRVSVARCARVSYESHETGGRSTVEEDLRLYGRLLGSRPLHASPAEHQATPDTQSRHVSERNDVRLDIPDEWDHEGQHGNLVGWRQYRKMLPGEACAPLPEEYRR